MSEDNERWLTDGNCNKCRRNNYCKTRCKKNEERQRAAMFNALDSASGGMLSFMNRSLYKR